MTSPSDLSPEEARLLDALGSLPPVEPPADQRERFRARAAGARPRPASLAPRFLLAFAASLILVLAAGWYRERRTAAREVAALRDKLTRALADRSVATRFQAVQLAGESTLRDATVTAALTESLLHDPSANVRAAAAEALGQVAGADAFSAAAARAVAMERSPFVHAALLRASARLTPTARARLLALLMARPDLDPVLRAEAQASLAS